MRGESSAALSTTVLPQIRAGKVFQAMFAIGVFAGTINPATPRGWRTVWLYLLGIPEVKERP